MATVSFYAENGSIPQINALAGSGLAFFGLDNTQSIVVGQYQQTTYITDSVPTLSTSVQTNNVGYSAPNSGLLNNTTNLNLLAIPNYLSSLNIRVTNSTPCQIINAKFYTYDRTLVNGFPANPQSGVLVKGAIVCHPWNTNSPNGSGSSSWVTMGGTGSYLDFSSIAATTSPGSGGLAPSGAGTVDSIHDFYVNLSVAPTSVGSKPFAGFFSCEYL